MGVSGCGKSFIGQKLADQLNFAFVDGDDFHSEHNKQKMGNGISLNDQDRLSWLNQLRDMFSKGFTGTLGDKKGPFLQSFFTL